MKKRTYNFLDCAHALHALTSLLGILLVPREMMRLLPEAPAVQPLIFIRHLTGDYFPLLEVLASIGLWLLLMRRIYSFRGLWHLARHGHLQDFQPPPLPDTPQSRMTASVLRLE